MKPPLALLSAACLWRVPFGGRGRTSFTQDPSCSERKFEQTKWKDRMLLVKLEDQLAFSGGWRWLQKQFWTSEGHRVLLSSHGECCMWKVCLRHPFPFSSLNWKDLVLFSPSDKPIITNMEVVSQFNNFKSILYYFALFRGSTCFSAWVCRVFIQLISTQPFCLSVRIYSLLLISSHSLFTASGIDLWW